MKQYLLFKSKKGNRYLFDRKKKKMISCHPVLYYLSTLEDSGMDLKKWIYELEGACEIDGAGSISKEEIEYYYRKYQILKQNGHFESFEQEKRLNLRLTPDNVKELVANISEVTFETTEKCNLQCLYCGYGKFYTHHEKRSEKSMILATAKKVITYLQECWNSPLNRSLDQNIYISFYGGEPLLNFQLIRGVVDFVKSVNLNGKRVIFAITTNGVLLDKYMDFLEANDFNLLISLDGDKSNNDYRLFKGGKSAFPLIQKNIVALQAKYPDYFLKKVNFNAVIHNKNSVSEAYNFIKQNFGKIPQVAAINAFGIREDQKEQFWKTYSNVEESLYKSEDYSLIQRDMFIKLPNVQSMSNFLHTNTDCSFNDYNDMLYSSVGKARLPTGTCLPFSKKIFVTASGKILPCEKINHEYALGTVDEKGVNINCDSIAEKYNQWYEKIASQCYGCYQSEDCFQCIFYLDLSSDPTICKGFMNQEDYLRYVSSQVDFLETAPAMYYRILKEVMIK